jgi:hypothetical protein
LSPEGFTPFNFFYISGGVNDMFDEVLKFGSMIVEALSEVGVLPFLVIR